MSTPTPITTPTIEERLRDVDLVALYDSTMQGAQYLLSMLRRRIEASATSGDQEYWRSRRRRVLDEKRVLPTDNPMTILVQRDIWTAEMDALGRADHRVTTA